MDGLDVYPVEISENEIPGTVWVWDCYESDWKDHMEWLAVATPPPMN